MRDWALAIMVVIVVAVALLLLAWWVRLRWLNGLSGRFECALKVGGAEDAWALGVGRYYGEQLQWYRAFSLAFRPRHAWRRTEVILSDSRRPSVMEASALYDDQQIITLQLRSGAEARGLGRYWQVAVPIAAVTGLLSWLEAAAPGEGDYRLSAGPAEPGAEWRRPESS